MCWSDAAVPVLNLQVQQHRSVLRAHCHPLSLNNQLGVELVQTKPNSRKLEAHHAWTRARAPAGLQSIKKLANNQFILCMQMYTYYLRPVLVGHEATLSGPANNGEGHRLDSSSVGDSTMNAAFLNEGLGDSVHSWEVQLVLEYCDQGSLRSLLNKKGAFTLPGQCSSIDNPTVHILAWLAIL